MYYFNKFFNILIHKLCGIIIVSILILVAFFLGLRTANAESMQFKLNDTNQTDYIFYYNCSSSTTCTTNYATASITNGGRSYFHNIDNMTVGTSGINIVYTTNQKFQPGYMYSINSYVCYTNANNLTGEVHIGNTAATALNSSMAYSVTTRSANNSSVANWYVSPGGTSLKNQISASYCSYFSTVFSPNVTGEWVSLHLTRGSVSSGDKIFFVGYQVSNLGAYNPSLASSITQVINNTATETQEQVQALNTKISNMLSEQEITNEKLDDVKTEQEKTNEQLKETHDYLTDDTPPSSDISALGNVQGLLPPGPLDSLLNIPFVFLSVVVSSFGSNCVPITGTWVFGETLTIPCFGDMFYSNVPSGMMIFIDLVPSVFILIMYFKYLYKKVDRAVSMETSTDDEWGVI